MIYVFVKTGAKLTFKPEVWLGHISNRLIQEMLLYLRDEDYFKTQTLVAASLASVDPEFKTVAVNSFKKYSELIIGTSIPTAVESSHTAAIIQARKDFEEGKRDSPDLDVTELAEIGKKKEQPQQSDLRDKDIEAMATRYKELFGDE